MEKSNRYFRDTVALVDLDAIAHNVNQFRRRLPDDCRLMAAVKANAYGHGSVPVSRAALAAGATDLAVAFLDEALELRAGGITAPILVLGHISERGIEPALEAGITLTVFDDAGAEKIARVAARTGHRARLHIKVDTGMGRIGLWEDAVVPFAERWARDPRVTVEGIFTHFATADEMDKSYAMEQHGRFLRVLQQLQERRIRIPVAHCANSAAAIDLPRWSHGMIRLGISMYGYYPSAQVSRERVRLRPALTLKTRIIHLKRPPAGTGISYGKTVMVTGNQWIATIPTGYADGYSRRLSNRGTALVRGRRVPVIGRVCMDQLMLDVTSAMPVEVGDEVVLYGKQGNEEIHVDEVADLLGTISYEITCMLGHRIPRVYLQAGRVMEVNNPLQQAPGSTGGEDCPKGRNFGVEGE
ncbi:alanine racemase [Kroppenstedtia guangzhouensis]|uniref:Alanine racemase n=1 Tax=Kroppenstedtia guangzhouensis TaxID=1274356 RepID=A0ABQ1GR05_9BACL|nr:alanine racemase [Kroppenstedtia guangzhouensis]GGA48695.1 alanine racemase [Kroppenstedtia guangzhouensis]